MKGRGLSIFVVFALVASIFGALPAMPGERGNHNSCIYRFGNLDRPGRGDIRYRRGLGRRRRGWRRYE